jgi:hypothetical protein
MATFSQRKGLAPIRVELQIDEMDAALHNQLWNCYFYLFDFFEDNMYAINYNPPKRDIIKDYKNIVWHSHFGIPIDDEPYHKVAVIAKIKEKYFKMNWHEVYSFIEFTLQYMGKMTGVTRIADDYTHIFNKILEQNLAGYRIADKFITQITDEGEIKTITDAIEKSREHPKLSGVNLHLKQALSLFSNRTNPNYSSSVGQSISAIEALVKILTGNDESKLGVELNVLKTRGQINIHPALLKGFENIYGWTSSKETGIRHAMMGENEPPIDFDDAKYMLVSCSAFVNYLVGKAIKAKIL